MEKIEPPIKTIGLPEQRARMKHIHPHFQCEIVRINGRSTLVCHGSVQPTPINGFYQSRIEYAAKRTPKVWIESPKLLRRDPEQRIPHTYADDQPCLFKEDFRSDMFIAQTIVPWLMLWLMFYEAWRVTGEWQGEGLHPQIHEFEEELAA